MTRAGLLASLLALSGCDLILGIEDWKDPSESTGGTEPSSSSSSSSSTSGGGGASSSSSTSGTSGTPTTGTCADQILDVGETDVDCGGDACAPCGPGRACANDADCSTLACVDEVCAAETPETGCPAVDPGNPTCADCEKNGDETDVDCGGDACASCDAGEACHVDADCAMDTICTGSVCTTGVIVPVCGPVDPLMPSCVDCEQNGDETGVDCGGDACAPCP